VISIKVRAERHGDYKIYYGGPRQAPMGLTWPRRRWQRLTRARTVPQQPLTPSEPGERWSAMASDSGLPLDPDSFAAGVTIWASPGLVTDPARPDLGSIAALTVLPSLSLHTSDEHPGAEPVDVIASNLLAQGFALLTAFDPASLVALPILREWVGAVSPDGRRLTVVTPIGTLYDGELAEQIPPRWHEAINRRGLLVLLVSTDATLRGPGQVTSMDDARQAGNIVAAQIRVQRHR